jgi:cytochrome P450
MTTLLTRPAPVAPRAFPLLGHSLSLLRRDRVGYLTSLQPIGDMVELRMGTRPFLLLNSPDLIRTVLLEESKSFDRGRIFDKARPYVGDGLFTSQGSEHLRQRRSVQPAFHRARIERSVRLMSEVAREHVAAWRPGAIVDVEREMHVLASELIGRALFHAPQAGDVIRLAREELPTLVQGLGVRTMLPDFFTRVPLPLNRRFDAACAHFRDAAQRLVATYREERGDVDDFVSMLMGTRDARTGTAPSDTEIRDQIMTLLISGIETPATTLTWSLYELAKRPDLRARLEEEVDQVLGGGHVHAADLPSLRLTEAFVMENLRLHHPLWMLMRRAVRPVTIGGVHLAPGAEVIYSPAALHRDPTLFANPAELRPERWLDGAPTAEMQRGFIPFGLGNRQCIGDAFAMTQMKISIAAVVAGHRLALPDGFRPRTVSTSIVHLNRLPMVVRPRTAPRSAEGSRS